MPAPIPSDPVLQSIGQQPASDEDSNICEQYPRRSIEVEVWERKFYNVYGTIAVSTGGGTSFPNSQPRIFDKTPSKIVDGMGNQTLHPEERNRAVSRHQLSSELIRYILDHYENNPPAWVDAIKPLHQTLSEGTLYAGTDYDIARAADLYWANLDSLKEQLSKHIAARNSNTVQSKQGTLDEGFVEDMQLVFDDFLAETDRLAAEEQETRRQDWLAQLDEIAACSNKLATSKDISASEFNEIVYNLSLAYRCLRCGNLEKMEHETSHYHKKRHRANAIRRSQFLALRAEALKDKLAADPQITHQYRHISHAAESLLPRSFWRKTLANLPFGMPHML